MAQTIKDTIDDFGFTFVDESAIVGESKQVKDITSTSMDATARLDSVMNLISPFLKNLQANPDQPYLKWPDRAAKVKAFEEKLNAIATGVKK